jgi:MtfA peptidase
MADMPDGWRQILEREFAYFRKLDARQRTKLAADVSTFAGKQFVGIEGFTIDDRVRIHVAATAALLVVELDMGLFGHVRRVEMREARYVTEHGDMADGHYEYATHDTGPIGVVQLAWRSVLEGAARPDGTHVAIHELAHALDHGLGHELLVQHDRCEHWRQSLRGMPLHGGMVVADVEGPELFAVASELFFERPMTLMRIDPSLFFELHGIYKLDPRSFG